MSRLFEKLKADTVRGAALFLETQGLVSEWQL